MITFDRDNIRFTNRVVGVALDRDRVLLQRAFTDDFWALPGGRAELLEPSPQTLIREMQEELGVEVQIDRLLWVAENFFVHQGQAHHELGLYYLMHLPAASPLRDQIRFEGQEGDLTMICEWFPIETLEQVHVFPTFLRTGLKDLPTSPVHIVHRDSTEESAHP